LYLKDEQIAVFNILKYLLKRTGYGWERLLKSGKVSWIEICYTLSW